MNTTKILVCYLSIFLCMCCDNTSEQEPVDNTLVGSWNIVSISGGFAGVDDDFEKGAIVWSFDSGNKTLIVKNDNDTNKVYDGLESGKYAYSIVEIGGNSFLSINDIEFGALFLAKNELVIDQNNSSGGSVADKFILKLAR